MSTNDALSQFFVDHLPANARNITRTLVALSVAAVSAAAALSFVWEYLRRHEKRRLLLLQRPPPVPMAPYEPVADDESDYWLRELHSMPRLHRRPTSGQDALMLAGMSMRRSSSFADAGLPSRSHSSHDGDGPRRLQRPAAPPRSYRVLSLDGGGVRGIVSATIVMRLTKEFPTLLDSIDLIAGTSTGGLLCLLLAGGYSPRQCVDMYRFNAPIIFESYWLRKLLSPLHSSYSDKNKLDICKFYMGDRTLSQLNKRVVITAFRLDGGPEAHGRSTFFPVGRWRPCLFSNLPLGNGAVPPDSDLTCVDAAMRTTAAPSYFPIYQGFVDGAVYANNPTIPALARVCSHLSPRVTLDNVLVLSIGCGQTNQAISREDCEAGDWGIGKWSPHLLDLLMDSGEMATDLYASLMLGDRYQRCNLPLPAACALDDADKIEQLYEFACEADLSATIQWLESSGFVRQTVVPTSDEAAAVSSGAGGDADPWAGY
jgi:patatin-like phospholipase/acyl hydrolase